MTEARPTIILTRGIPASGKTTWAKNWVAESPENRVRLNRDDLRRMMRGDAYTFDHEVEQTITRIQHEAARAALKQGKSVVIDDTNLRARFVKQWYALGPVEFKDFEVDADTAHARDCMREHPVGAKVILDFERRYLGREGYKLPAPPERPTTLAEDIPDMVPYVPNTDLPEAFIFDVDGTLAHIDPANPRDVYDASRAAEDLADEHVVEMLGNLRVIGVRIIIVSGRKAAHANVTANWLHDNGAYFDEIFTRADGDDRKDWIVKYEIFDQHLRNRYNVRGVFDDRNRVVEMWRAIGLKCYHVQPGDF